jgi:N-acyl amino acid synthase of PEP-CTERM/exosortase system
MEDIFKLRFEVYCEEKGFLDPSDYPYGMEMDEFDQDAVHLVVHGDGNLPIGYMRLIDGVNGPGYPMFAHGMEVYDDFALPPSGEAIEISRMIVRSDYRHAIRLTDDGFSRSSRLPACDAKNASDLVQLKLLRLMYRHAVDNDAGWIYAAMEPTLHRKFRMMGIPFGPIGPAADYFGEVKPYAMDLRHMEEVLEARFPRTLEFFESGLPDEDCTVVGPGDWSPPMSLSFAA